MRSFPPSPTSEPAKLGLTETRWNSNVVSSLMYLAATQGKKDGHQALLADFLFRDAAGVFTITAQMLSKTAVTRYPERQVALMITDTTCIALQTSPEERPSVPPWFAEVVLIAQYLTQHGVLEALTHSHVSGYLSLTRCHGIGPSRWAIWGWRRHCPGGQDRPARGGPWQSLSSAQPSADPRSVGASTCLRHDSGRQWKSLRSF